MDIGNYRPGRFEYLMKEPFVRELWAYLTGSGSIHAMIAATKRGEPAIMPLISEIERQFAEELTSSAYPEDDVVVLVNNMIKQIMEQNGYEHAACGICRATNIIKSSGIYKTDAQNPGVASN